jgi:hypothetical protein
MKVELTEPQRSYLISLLGSMYQIEGNTKIEDKEDDEDEFDLGGDDSEEDGDDY